MMARGSISAVKVLGIAGIGPGPFAAMTSERRDQTRTSATLSVILCGPRHARDGVREPLG
ncbi:hypothetical protein P3T23_006086 [Paraburkholderia sp. GAS448]